MVVPQVLLETFFQSGAFAVSGQHHGQGESIIEYTPGTNTRDIGYDVTERQMQGGEPLIF
jgi:hypothetical protein